MAERETAKPRMNLPTRRMKKEEVKEIKRAPKVKRKAVMMMVRRRPYLSTEKPGKNDKSVCTCMHLGARRYLITLINITVNANNH